MTTKSNKLIVPNVCELSFTIPPVYVKKDSMVLLFLFVTTTKILVETHQMKTLKGCSQKVAHLKSRKRI